MGPIDALWHVSNLFAPALGVALILAALVKAVWRGQAGSFRRLAVWGAAGGSLATLAALALFGRDGTMVGYALLLTGISLPQWWLVTR
jgi:hypothetical protein